MAKSETTDGKFSLIYNPQFLDYKFGDEHPMNPLRLELAVDLIRRSGLLEGSRKLVDPRPATEEELAAVHRLDYIHAVKSAVPGCRTATLAMEHGLGTDDNPIFANMHDVASLITGGTLHAAELVMDGAVDHAFNIAGGLHHAMESMASGFCIYNDAAVAIAAMRKAHGAKVMYLDFDVHHGDGVQSAFYGDPNVLTVSFHETGRYLFPGTGSVEEIGWGKGTGYSVNVPFEPFTEDESWLEAVTDLVPLLAAAFKPDLIVSQHGCDTHMLDPMAHLSLTTQAMAEAAALVHAVAHAESNGRWVAVAGGGYNIWCVFPRALTAIWAEMGDRPLPSDIPPSWREHWQPLSPEPLPTKFHDSPGCMRPAPRREEIVARNRRIVAKVKSEILPLIIRPS